MKKKLILMGIAAVFVLTTIIGGTLAAFNAQTDKKATSKISTKDLGIGIYEMEQEDKYLAVKEGKSFFIKGNIPGTTISKNLIVRNDCSDSEDSSYDAYVRVTIYKSWGSVETSDVGPNFVKDSSLNTKEVIKEMNGIEALHLFPDTNVLNSTGWIIYSDTNEEMILYYTKPIKAGEETTPFITKVKIDERLGNDYADHSIMIEAKADAVQVIDGVNAISSAWGISANINPESKEIENISDLVN